MSNHYLCKDPKEDTDQLTWRYSVHLVITTIACPGQDCKITDKLVFFQAIFWSYLQVTNIYFDKINDRSYIQLFMTAPPWPRPLFANSASPQDLPTGLPPTLKASASASTSKSASAHQNRMKSFTLPFDVVPPHPTPPFFGFLKIVEGFLSFPPSQRLWMIYYWKWITWSKRFFQKLWDLYMRHSNRQIHRRRI